MLYDTILNFYLDILLSSNDLANTIFVIGGNDYDMQHWLAHTCSIITLIALVLCLFIFVKWIFKVVSGLIRL